MVSMRWPAELKTKYETAANTRGLSLTAYTLNALAEASAPHRERVELANHRASITVSQLEWQAAVDAAASDPMRPAQQTAEQWARGKLLSQTLAVADRRERQAAWSTRLAALLEPCPEAWRDAVTTAILSQEQTPLGIPQWADEQGLHWEAANSPVFGWSSAAGLGIMLVAHAEARATAGPDQGDIQTEYARLAIAAARQIEIPGFCP